ncbi:SHQ1-domain-containing protein [Coemansia reversa NRRL 1564]|uniref:SHQ1-domain-containing protein n=1 Tax=Coemansia reversa (strain ATCC 12441 / NRRL 1564) TaxID=763665 RepID=A0A2G5BHI3_COERN|nr:SHQ1-domain-containing protein [Coemansia reversa NRRL 1564]|eukprot:PIA18478.1 SHQ1-domain-containing protein [Coemansia reversa NRRL 1564]
MITPRFEVRQDEANVYVTIHAPHIRAQSIEFDVDVDQLKFFASPYYLRLTFPGKVTESDESSATYDATLGEILVTLSKQTPGEEFPNLDLLTGLLATRREKYVAGFSEGTALQRPIIEEIGDTNSSSDTRTGVNNDVDVDAALEQAYTDEDFDWEFPQKPISEEAEALLVGTAKYGFDSQYSGYLTHVHTTANEVNEVADPENMTSEARHNGRISFEDKKFDNEYYIDNYINDDDVQPLIQHTSRFTLALRCRRKNQNGESIDMSTAAADVLTQQLQQTRITEDNYITSEDVDSCVKFTDAEKKQMINLPRKTHLISNKMAVYLGLVDILFAYLLELRINAGEFNVESVWAIGAVSSTLSNLEQFSTLRSVAVACYRRGLAYPLYRNWELCEKTFEDVYTVCSLGCRAILKIFLELKRLFDEHDIYYIYSKLYFDDYCIWLQTSASEKIVQSLARKLHRLEVDKDEVGWNLNEYEDLALMTSESDLGENTDNEMLEPDAFQ